jgi:hypothetical protein
MPEGIKISVQFCAHGQDITSDYNADMDATEVRAWTEDSMCLGAVTLSGDGQWHASASDVCDWLTYEPIGYTGWESALAALLAVSGHALPGQR